MFDVAAPALAQETTSDDLQAPRDDARNVQTEQLGSAEDQNRAGDSDFGRFVFFFEKWGHCLDGGGIKIIIDA